MASFEDYFITHAKISRRALARFAEAEPDRVDSAADDLGFGRQLTVDEAEELLSELEDPEDNEEDAPTEREGDEDDEEEEQ